MQRGLFDTGVVEEPVSPYWLTPQITEALIASYANRVKRGICMVIPELPSATGTYLTSRIDVWVQFFFDCDRNRKIAYEVKTSRSDFLAELRNPDKRKFALRVSNEYYFATPPGLILPSELPEEAGLVEITQGRVKVVRKAPWREPPPPHWRFIAVLSRKIAGLSPIDLTEDAD